MKHPALSLFLSFAKIGAFTFGGGYAMIPLIKREVVHNKKWIAESEFGDMLVLAQSAPGAISINTSIFVGYRLIGLRGALAALSGVLLPSFLMVFIIASFFTSFRNNPVVNSVFKGMRPAVVALIVAPALNLTKGLGVWRVLLAAAAIAATLYFRFSPVYLLIAGATGGILYGYFKRRKI